MVIYNLYGINSNYVLLTINILSILIYLYSKMIFIHKNLTKYLIVLHLFSLMQIICSILDSYYEYNFIIKYSILFFNFVILIYFNNKEKWIVNKYNEKFKSNK